jgi:hypothetical protein
MGRTGTIDKNLFINNIYKITKKEWDEYNEKRDKHVCCWGPIHSECDACKIDLAFLKLHKKIQLAISISQKEAAIQLFKAGKISEEELSMCLRDESKPITVASLGCTSHKEYDDLFKTMTNNTQEEE